MSQLLAPVESSILDEHGKPFIRHEPVRVDRDAPTDMVFLIPVQHNLVFRSDEEAQTFARRCGVITNVGR